MSSQSTNSSFFARGRAPAMAASALLLLAPSVQGAPGAHAPTRFDTINGPSDPSLNLLAGGTDFGGAVAGGDLNGDGFSDVVVGAEAAGFSDVAWYTGAAFVYMGGPAGLDKNPDFVIRGWTPYGNLGRSVLIANIGGDNHADLVVGAPSRDGTASAVYAWFGGDTFKRQVCCAASDCGATGMCDAGVCRLRSIGAPSVTVRVGANGYLTDGAAFGFSLAALNYAGHTDTIRDLAIGAPNADFGKGSVYLMQGPLSAGGDISLPNDFYSGAKVPGWVGRFNRTGPGPQQFGYRIANGGNLDALDQSSGHSLFVFGVGAQVYVFAAQFAAASPSTLADVTIVAASARAHITGPAWFGRSIGNPMYAGYPMAGSAATRPFPAILSPGTSGVLFITNQVLGDMTVTIDDPHLAGVYESVANPLVSGSLDPADINGDGMPDMALMDGRQPGSLEIFTSVGNAHTAPGDMSYPFPAGTNANRIIEFVGDIDNDGRSDVVVADPNFTTVANAPYGEGRLHVLHDRNCPTCPQRDVREVCYDGGGQCRHPGVANACTAGGMVACGNFTTATPFDTIAPALTTVAPVKLTMNASGGVSYAVPLPLATDNCDAPLTVLSNAPALFPVGVTTVTFTARDQNGNTGESFTTVEVVDVAPPSIDELTANPNVLTRELSKKFRGRMVPVIVTAKVTDADDAAPTCKIEAVSVNADCFSKPKKHPQFALTGNMTLTLKGHRCAKGNERVYTISVVCTDASGLSAHKSTRVTVPKRALPKGEKKRQRCATTKASCESDKASSCRQEQKRCESEQQRCEAAAKTKADKQKCSVSKDRCDAAHKAADEASRDKCESEQKKCLAPKAKKNKKHER